MTEMATEAVDAAATPSPAGLPFVVASRPQRRFQNTQTVDNTNAGSFQVVQLPATGWNRRVSLFFTVHAEDSDGVPAGALVAGDAPFNLISGITLTDATGQPVFQPISGYSLYLWNKYFSSGSQAGNSPWWVGDPVSSPEYGMTATTTDFDATFRLDLDFEIDSRTGYGCIPNLDSNASLQLKVDYAAITNAFTAATMANVSMTMRTSVEYWAPVGNTVGGMPVSTAPPGAGDYREVRYETQAVNAGSEHLVNASVRGGLIQGVLLISRNAGVRTAITAASNLGVLLDNQPINEGIPIEEHYDQIRRMYGYNGTDLTNDYSTATVGTVNGLDQGVVPINFSGLSLGRNSWLNTRGGSLFQFKVTPGAGATTLEIVTGIMQVKDAAAFYNAG